MKEMEEKLKEEKKSAAELKKGLQKRINEEKEKYLKYKYENQNLSSKVNSLIDELKVVEEKKKGQEAQLKEKINKTKQL